MRLVTHKSHLKAPLALHPQEFAESVLNRAW